MPHGTADTTPFAASTDDHHSTDLDDLVSHTMQEPPLGFQEAASNNTQTTNTLPQPITHALASSDSLARRESASLMDLLNADFIPDESDFQFDSLASTDPEQRPYIPEPRYGGPSHTDEGPVQSSSTPLPVGPGPPPPGFRGFGSAPLGPLPPGARASDARTPGMMENNRGFRQTYYGSSMFPPPQSDFNHPPAFEPASAPQADPFFPFVSDFPAPPDLHHADPSRNGPPFWTPYPDPIPSYVASDHTQYGTSPIHLPPPAAWITPTMHVGVTTPDPPSTAHLQPISTIPTLAPPPANQIRSNPPTDGQGMMLPPPLPPPHPSPQTTLSSRTSLARCLISDEQGIRAVMPSAEQRRAVVRDFNSNVVMTRRLNASRRAQVIQRREEARDSGSGRAGAPPTGGSGRRDSGDGRGK
ncbi:MAG: hypothetical protein Q9224_007036 [Gallowayella concinna]